MNISFTKTISDISRFEIAIKEFNATIILVNYTQAFDGVIVVPDDTSQADQDNITNFIADYTNVLTEEEQSILYVDGILNNAENFSCKIRKDFINENIRLGITQLGKTKYVRLTMREINDCLSTMSLQDAIDECQIILDDLNLAEGTLDKECPFVNISRLTIFMAKLQAYLGV